MPRVNHFNNSFENMFPLPNFLEVPAIGVDITDGSVKYLEIVRHGKHFKVGRYGEKKLPEGAVIDGQIKDKRALVSVLASLKKEGILFANVSLPEEKAFLFKVMVPNADDSEIRANLSYQLETKVPVALSSAVFDYDLLKNSNKGSQSEAVVTVLPTEFVVSYLAAFKESGIQPLSFEIEGQAISRAVVPHVCEESAMVIDFGHKRTGLSVVSCGVVVYTSTIDFGGDVISQKIKEIMKVTDAEITRIKNEKGIGVKSPPELKEALTLPLGGLKDEINKHYNYWKTRVDEGKERPIEKIIICGGNSNIAGFKEYLSASINVKVEKGNVWQKLWNMDDYIPPIKEELSFGYATAIGLASTDL